MGHGRPSLYVGRRGLRIGRADAACGLNDLFQKLKQPFLCCGSASVVVNDLHSFCCARRLFNLITETSFDGRKQFFLSERFDQETIRAASGARKGLAAQGHAGHENEWDGGDSRIAPEGEERQAAIGTLHLDIAQDQVWLMIAGHLYALRAAGVDGGQI